MKDNHKKVAFIIVCWNNIDIVKQCLNSVQSQSYCEKIIYVIDNNSSDGSVDYIVKNFPDVILIKSSKNNGFAKGNNILIKEAIKDESIGYFALINSDAVLDKNWTSEIVNYITDRPRTAAAQGLTLDYFNHDIIDAKYVYVGDNFQSVQSGYRQKVNNLEIAPKKVFAVNAAAAIYTRAFIVDQKHQTLFDEKFYMYLEDVDVCFRAIVTGWYNYAIPSARAYHMGSVSSKKRANGYNIKMTFRNQAALLYKNMPFTVFMKLLPSALKFEVRFYKHLRKNEGEAIRRLAVKGRIIGLIRVPLYALDRRRIMSKRKISNRRLEEVMRAKGEY